MDLHGYVDCSIAINNLRRDFVFQELGDNELLCRGESRFRQKASLIWEIVCRVRSAELRGDKLGMQALYLEIGIARPTLTRLLELLERSDALMRDRDQQDHRRTHVILRAGFRERFDDCVQTMIAMLDFWHHKTPGRSET